MQEIRIHGFGGQGAVTLAHLLAQCGLMAGHQAQALPSFGVERRGAPVKAAVRIADEPIRVYSQSFHPDILVLMDKKLLERGLSEGIAESVTILVNSHEAIASPHPLYYVDAVAIANAEDLRSADGPFINIPLLGACAKVVGLPFDMVEKALREKWSGVLGEKNVRAAQAAYDGTKEAAV